eukprot:6209861-Pleurochrysis_carterae.AAC.2
MKHEGWSQLPRERLFGYQSIGLLEFRVATDCDLVPLEAFQTASNGMLCLFSAAPGGPESSLNNLCIIRKAVRLEQSE